MTRGKKQQPSTKDKLKGMLGAGGAILNHIAAELEERNPIYRAVLSLRDKATILLETHERTLCKNGQTQVIVAAKAFIMDITALLKSQKYVSQNIFRAHQHRLAEDCLDIIFTHQSTLEAAPGFWNQFKAFLNDFIECICEYKNTFAVEGTIFSENGDFQSLKNKIADLRDSLEEPTSCPSYSF